MITILIFSPFYFQSFHFPSGLPFERELPLFVIISLAVSLPSVQSLSFLDKSIPCPLYKYLIFQAEQVALPVCQVGSKVSKVASNQGRGRRRNWVTRRVKHRSIRKIANTSLIFTALSRKKSLQPSSKHLHPSTDCKIPLNSVHDIISSCIQSSQTAFAWYVYTTYRSLHKAEAFSATAIAIPG